MVLAGTWLRFSSMVCASSLVFRRTAIPKVYRFSINSFRSLSALFKSLNSFYYLIVLLHLRFSIFAWSAGTYWFYSFRGHLLNFEKLSVFLWRRLLSVRVHGTFVCGVAHGSMLPVVALR
jgi:hypothetical protein